MYVYRTYNNIMSAQSSFLFVHLILIPRIYTDCPDPAEYGVRKSLRVQTSNNMVVVYIYNVYTIHIVHIIILCTYIIVVGKFQTTHKPTVVHVGVSCKFLG